MRIHVKRPTVYILIAILLIITLWTFKSRDTNTEDSVTKRVLIERDYVFSDNTLKPIGANQTKSNIHPNKVNIYKHTLATNRIIHIQKTYLRTFHGKSPIYVYSSKVDNMISAHLKSYGTWEEDFLNQTGDFLKQYPDITFLDIGCNVGVYTIFAGKLGIKVVSVDPVGNNLILLSKSVHAGKFAENVTLVLNAVSDEYKTVIVDIPKENIGGAHIVNDIKPEVSVHEAETILLDDLVPYIGTNNVFIKMDVEGHEWNVLNGGHNLFQTKNVKAILMEWVHHRHTKNGQLIIDYLMKNGFLPYTDIAKTNILEPFNFYIWPENIFWIKR